MTVGDILRKLEKEDKERLCKALNALPGRGEFRVRIGHLSFLVQVDPERIYLKGKHVHGYCDADNQTIKVSATIATPEMFVEVLLHEMLHAIWYVRDLKDRIREERAVEAFGSGLTQLFRDNTWLATWIAKVLK